jgi:hypothetical protein
MKIIKYIFWTYLVLVCIALLIKLPPSESEGHLDKVVHCGIFVLAGALLLLSYGKSRSSFARLVLFAILIECAQGLTTYRSFEWLDLVANGTGLILSRVLVLTPFFSQNS